MEGSIADSASLRIRSRLQAGYHAATNKPEQGLFEELLKVPVAPSPALQETSDEPSEKDELSEPSAQAADKPSSADTRSEKEGVRDSEETSDEAQVSDAALLAIAQVVPAAVAADAPESKESVVQSSDNVELTSNVPEQTVAVAESPVVTAQAAAVADATVKEKVAQHSPATPLETDSENPSEQTEFAELAARVTPESDRHVELSATTPAPAVAETQKAQTTVRAEQDDSSADKPADVLSREANFAVPTDTTRVERSSREQGNERREKWYMSDNAESSSEPPAVDVHDHQERDDKESSSASLIGDGHTPAAEVPSAKEQTDAALAAQLTPLTPIVDMAAQSVAAAATHTAAMEGNAHSSRPSDRPSASGPSTAGPAVAPRSDASTANKATAEHDKGDVRQLSQQERVRLVQRVARSFSRLGPDGGQITLKLHPPQLGVLNVSVRIEGQTMSAKLQTESAAARDVILENLPVLRERLAEQGIDVARFQVDVASGGDLGAGGQPSNSFDGETNQGAGDNRSNIDYRRISRDSHARLQPKESGSRLMSSEAWSARSLADRTLDIRA